VWKLDPATNARSADLTEGMSIGVGSHYTYSDFTGSTALFFTSPRGHWRFTFESRFDNARVDAIVWDATVLPGTSAGIRIRALDAHGVPATAWLPAESMGVPDYFGYPTGQGQDRIVLTQHGEPPVGSSFELEVRLTTDGNVRPILHAIRLEWQRP
jgi:hypothetical protein